MVLASTAGILATPSAPGSGTDLTVGLTADGSYLLPGARYEVSVTNNGPQPLTSATIVVDLDPRVSGAVNPPPTCSVDTGAATLTCSFGPLATGATAATTTWVMFVLPPAPTTVTATATRASSTPPDPNPANDSATE